MKERAAIILQHLKKHYPNLKCFLSHQDPFQLLVAVILSAQCTDIRVNKVTPILFKRFKTAKDFAECNIKELETLIHSTGFYKNKAKNIQAMAKMLVKDFNSKVPKTMEELVKLPGVGRKTANVILAECFGLNEGVCVDTHVMRLSQRLGLSNHKDPIKIEQDLMKCIPKKDWETISLTLITHGRKVCNAKKPDCKGCFLNKVCLSAFKV